MAKVLREASQGLNFEPDISAPGMWRVPTNLDLCCIYRVPNRLRQIHPKPYTPQLLIIGPLHHSLKSQALEHLTDIDNTKFIGYLNMEQHKKVYLTYFAQKFDGENTINGLRNVIKEEEEAIRASYSESTAWIESQDFIEMILHDSVFILEYIWRRSLKGIMSSEFTGDILMDQVSLTNTVSEDLILLENQLPFFILEKLFDPIIETLFDDQTMRTIFIEFFGFKGKINENSKFKHITDLYRCARVETLKLEEGGEEDNGLRKYKSLDYTYNVEKLHCAGIKFNVLEEKLSLDVKFENGCLELPHFLFHESTEMEMRNVMAFEQCHYPYEAYVCSYIVFLGFLVYRDKDVDFLVENGIIKSWTGDYGLVVDMVNKLCMGVVDYGSYYYDIVCRINAHYENTDNRSRAVGKRVSFKDPWAATVTIVATLLLLMTLSISNADIKNILLKFFYF